MSVIALQGIREGVGTTSVTAALSWALQQLGESVLAIDFSENNLLRLHFNVDFEQTRGWARAYIDNTPWQTSALRYTPLLDILPFGKISTSEQIKVETQLLQTPFFWRDNLAQLIAAGNYRWILLDLPANNRFFLQQAATLTENIFVILNPDANCHVRLHQQEFSENCHFLTNQYTSTSQLQQSIHLLWQHSLSGLLPFFIHRDEAAAEAFAIKQPLGECRANSLAAEEILTLANWCLINLPSKT